MGACRITLLEVSSATWTMIRCVDVLGKSRGCAVLYCAVLCYAVLWCAVQCSAVLCSATLCHPVQRHTAVLTSLMLDLLTSFACRFPRTVLRKGNIKKQGKTGMYFERFAVGIFPPSRTLHALTAATRLVFRQHHITSR